MCSVSPYNSLGVYEIREVPSPFLKGLNVQAECRCRSPTLGLELVICAVVDLKGECGATPQVDVDENLVDLDEDRQILVGFLSWNA